MTSFLSCKAQILWKVSNDRGETSYLFGTFHKAPVSFCSEIRSFEKAFSECSQILGEVSYLESNANNLSGLMMMPQGSSLKELYNDEEYELILSYFESVSSFRPGKINFSPSGLLLYITNMLYRQAIPELSDEEMDFELQRLGQKKGKVIRGLVSYEEHMNYLAKLFAKDLSEQAEGLLNYIKLPASNPDSLRPRLQYFYQAYKSQDLSQIKEYADLFSSMDYGKELLSDRNRLWLPTIIEAINTKPTFIVIGVGHLVGNEGLIELLRNHGYTMIPMK